ncbi:MAG TPA: GH116 family glycosyl hydrolase [Pseudonocardiaceae bacterium]|jgi:uncharacterized protein (DUF608 family)|nr:GH116 family glycosyl hydrolase [Pseudonocardiaceae bacterium]
MTDAQAEPARSSWVNRRRFLTMSGTVAGAMMFAARPGTAFAAGTGGATGGYPDKGLSSADVAALYQRGNPSTYTGSELRYIGMPVGGGACGQVYLGGDGKLWYWDVDNAPAPPWANCNGPAYADPHIPFSPFGNGFVLRTANLTQAPPTSTTPPTTTTAPPATSTTAPPPSTTTTTSPPTTTSTAPIFVESNSSARAVDSTGFAQVAFTGQYPLGQVDYQDPNCPVSVHLDAFPPFVPGETDDSTLPVTVLAYTLTNTTAAPVVAELTGWAENPVAMRARTAQPTTLSSETVSGPQNYQGVQFTAANAPVTTSRPDIVFETWQQTDYAGWTVTGTAFGAGPVLVSQVPAYMLRFGNLNAQGPRFVTSHNFIAANNDPTLADSYVGTLTSGTFTVSRRYVSAWVGGGNNPGQTCLNVVVDGAVVGSLTADNTEPMHLRYLDLIRYQNKDAHIEIVDSATGGWGHINVSTISFSDAPVNPAPIGTLTDGGTVAVAVLGNDTQVTLRPSIADWSSPTAIATSGPGPVSIDGGLGTITGAVTSRVVLAPGQSHTVRFALAWFFPNLDRIALGFLTDIANLSRHYATRFASAQAVLGYLAAQLPRLEAATREWVRTWYTDSTLPHWFLERTLHTSGSLATNVAFRLSNGRFYAWEGVDCAPGTCEHVWSYAHGIARLFPSLERDTRQRVDLGIGFHPDTGEIGNRAEADMGWATDGQCGTILRFYREHQMSPDDTFLTANWPRIKQAVNWVISHDTRHDGTLEGAQPNTLDATWYGEVAWLTGMYDAALHAAAAMATEMNDTAFAQTCTALARSGAHSIATALWNGEYFVQLVDPSAPDAPNSNVGCDIDQMLGQNAAWQLGLPRVFDPAQATTALASIFHYNYVTDPAAYRAANPAIPGGRWYAMAGEPAMIMTTFPHGGAAQANGNPPAGVAMYFNESWTGQEYQLAAHMIYEGLVDQGLIVTNAVHNRYAPAKRNPYNEIECSEHYTRAMASYGVFLAACGFSCHGPRASLTFAPRITPENFAAAFTAAGGWGLFRQQRVGRQQVCSIEVRYGQVRVGELALRLPAGATSPRVRVTHNGRPIPATIAADGVDATVTLGSVTTVPTYTTLTATLSW